MACLRSEGLSRIVKETKEILSNGKTKTETYYVIPTNADISLLMCETWVDDEITSNELLGWNHGTSIPYLMEDFNIGEMKATYESEE